MAVERPAAADEVSDDPELPDYPGAATGTGAWLATHGYSLGAAALVVLTALLVWRIMARTSQG